MSDFERMIRWINRSAVRLLVVFAVAVMWGCGDDVEGEEPGQWNIEEPDSAIQIDELLDFGEVELGEQAHQVLSIENVGDYPVRIDDVATPESFDVVDEQLEVPVTVDPGELREIEVVFHAQDTGPVEEHLIVETSDSKAATVQVELVARVPGPCLQIEPAPVYDFGEVRWSTTETMSFELHNCSREDVTEVELDGSDGDEVFDARLAETSASGIALEPGVTTPLEVEFTPMHTRFYEAQILLNTNVPTDTSPVVDVSGEGGPYGCPKPVIQASVDGGEAVDSLEDSVFNAQPLETVELDAGASFDPDGGTIESVEWSLMERPQDSGAQLEEDSNGDVRQLHLDLAGSYVVELDVRNEEGDAACERARLTIQAVSEHDIHVQLVWDTPGDPNRYNDDGTDMDLHFLHPGGSWTDFPYDCHWRNPEPSWGDPDDTADDPSLDADTTDGWGPENINLNQPEDVIYSVGVKYFDDRGYGPSTATVRVFLEGELVREATSPSMEGGQFWDGLRVDWPTRSVDLVDELYERVPGGGASSGQGGLF